MAQPGALFTLLYGVLFELQLVTMVTSESRGDEFKMEPGELELLYDETLDHYVIQIEQNQVRLSLIFCFPGFILSLNGKNENKFHRHY